MQKITSPDNQRFKSAAKLLNSRGRKQQGKFLIDGVREFSRARASDIRFAEIFLHEDRLDEETIYQLQQEDDAQLQDAICTLPAGLFNKISFGDRNEGIVAVAHRPNTDLEVLDTNARDSQESLLVGVVESVEKPGNLGAVFRSADGAGLDAIIVANPLCDPFHPNSIRASMGTVFSMKFACTTSHRALEWLQQNSIQCFVTQVDADKSYFECDYSSASAIIMGNEAHGLSPLWNQTTQPIAIPMQGIADSLNLSVSAALVFYEARRQRVSKNKTV